MANAVDWTQYFILRSLSSVVHCFDVDENMRTVGAFGSLYSKLSKRRHERACDNIQRSFPQLDDFETQKLAEESIRNMFQLFAVDSLAMPRLLNRENWPDKVRMGTIGEVIPLLVREEPAIFITGHTGNWELLGFLLSLLGFKMTALARPIDNPLINDWLLGLRQSHGMEVITKFGAVPEIDQIVRNNGRIGFIADQNAGEKGLFVPFLGRMASSYKSIGLLAMRHKVPIVTGFARRTPGRFDYELHAADIMRPESWEDKPDPLFYITARFNRAIEQMVRLAPEQYLWVHRRWKSRPKWEREGKPMPERMIRKLETLPWMTSQLLERLVRDAAPKAGSTA
jgi:KDO2-lipid IV(A) lauroyltransferase